MVAIGRYEYSSSDEECGVPPVPVGSDDGTVLFFWAAEGPVTVACVTVLRGRIPRQKDSARNPCFGLLCLLQSPMHTKTTKGQPTFTLTENGIREADAGPTFSVGDILEYSGCVRVEVLAVHLDDVPAYYTIRMPDGKEKQTVPNLLEPWEDSKGLKSEPEPNWVGDAPHLHPTPAKPPGLLPLLILVFELMHTCAFARVMRRGVRGRT